MNTTYGKSAFELAVRTAKLSGTKVILPAFISHDFVGILKKYRISPIFVDVDPDSWQLDPAAVDVEDLRTARSLVLLHTFGLPADGLAFRELCDRHELLLIEDCARAMGGQDRNGLVGSHGDFAAYSLSKVAPVRRGGLLVARAPIEENLSRAHSSPSGVANSMLLLKLPGLSFLEGPLYRILRETAAYPGEVGLYEPPPLESPEKIVSVAFEAFLPSYVDVLTRKREIGLEIRRRLEPFGFRFQSDPGNHLYTAIGALVPESVDRHELRAHLRRRAINSYTLWGDPLGTSRVAAEAWGTNPRAYPITTLLADRLLHFPINRFMRTQHVDRIIAACYEGVEGAMT